MALSSRTPQTWYLRTDRASTTMGSSTDPAARTLMVMQVDTSSATAIMQPLGLPRAACTPLPSLHLQFLCTLRLLLVVARPLQQPPWLPYAVPKQRIGKPSGEVVGQIRSLILSCSCC
mmetsp:Transcript_23787/g.60529  ORF Transcript_23787/g.60529 Transcript_23787/m.60529 type:complete len:118 (-) Transcript_23787:137-490(-)